MIILASASPRRSELLKMLCLDFEVRPSMAEETVPEGLSPEQTVMHLAKLKYDSVAAGCSPEDAVIAADTIVVFNGEIFGKPRNEEDARHMLETLSGQTHTVYTGLCVNGKCAFEKSDVTFRDLSDDEIIRYINSGEPMDKAGSYGIQGLGASIVRHIDGDYFNIVGLPVCLLGSMLKDIGVSII